MNDTNFSEGYRNLYLVHLVKDTKYRQKYYQACQLTLHIDSNKLKMTKTIGSPSIGDAYVLILNGSVDLNQIFCVQASRPSPNCQGGGDGGRRHPPQFWINIEEVSHCEMVPLSMTEPKPGM